MTHVFIGKAWGDSGKAPNGFRVVVPQRVSRPSWQQYNVVVVSGQGRDEDVLVDGGG